MKTVVEVPRIESLEGRPGYGSFTNDLQLVYNLGGMTPNELRWTEMKAPTTEFGVPDVILDPEGDAPQLSVGLYPVNEGSVVTGSHVYQAPLLLRGVDRWQSSPLRDYKVKHWRGRPESETQFRKQDSYGLAGMIDGIVEGIDGNTPVVESLAVLPISNDGSYTTEFLPEIRTRVGEHRDYKISVIMEDGMSVYSALTKGQNRPIHDVNEHETTSRWQADMVADLSEMEKMFLPDSSGHMILIATPVQEKPRLGYGGDFGLGSGFGNDFGYGGGMKGFGGGGMMRGGGSIGGVSISSGTNTGSASMFDGELESSSAGKPIIFHTRYLGFKADQVSRWGVPELDKLSDALGAYEIQQN